MASEHRDTSTIDLAIVGGGPAGMSAALTAGRGRLETVIVNGESPRNAVTTASHGFLTRDRAHPTELLAIGKEQLAKYETVSYVDTTVTAIAKSDVGFTMDLATGSQITAYRLIIATGHVDDLELPGIEDVYGTSVYPCMFCDEYSHPSTTFAETLGTTSSPNEWGMTTLDVDDTSQTNITGLYVIGDGETGFSGLIAAAAEGAACAESIVHEIATERWSSR